MVDIKIKLKETKTKFIFVTVFNTINFALIVMGNIKQPLSISDYFLGLFMANLMLYFIYYCAMKKVHKEPIPCTAYIFGFLTISPDITTRAKSVRNKIITKTLTSSLIARTIIS